MLYPAVPSRLGHVSVGLRFTGRPSLPQHHVILRYPIARVRRWREPPERLLVDAALRRAGTGDEFGPDVGRAQSLASEVATRVSARRVIDERSRSHFAGDSTSDRGRNGPPARHAILNEPGSLALPALSPTNRTQFSRDSRALSSSARFRCVALFTALSTRRARPSRSTTGLPETCPPSQIPLPPGHSHPPGRR